MTYGAVKEGKAERTGTCQKKAEEKGLVISAERVGDSSLGMFDAQ